MTTTQYHVEVRYTGNADMGTPDSLTPWKRVPAPFPTVRLAQAAIITGMYGGAVARVIKDADGTVMFEYMAPAKPDISVE